jgi:hypothetical protein
MKKSRILLFTLIFAGSSIISSCLVTGPGRGSQGGGKENHGQQKQHGNNGHHDKDDHHDK